MTLICLEVFLNKFDKEQNFLGDNKAYKRESTVTTPHKKPKDQELNETQKQENKELCSQRIGVEPLICLVKIFRVASERLCLVCEQYTKVILTVCGLVCLPLKKKVLLPLKSF